MVAKEEMGIGTEIHCDRKYEEVRQMRLTVPSKVKNSLTNLFK
jgi:hypothetical protein